MDTRADDFRRLEELEKERGGRLMPVPDEDLKRLEAGDKPMRKNWMRNQPCVCGSSLLMLVQQHFLNLRPDRQKGHRP